MGRLMPSVVEQCRKEYGESFKDVVLGYARMGYSKNFVAKQLSTDRSWFQLLLKRYKLDKCFLPQGEQNGICRGGWPKGKKRGSKRCEI